MKTVRETEFYKNWSEQKLTENADTIAAFYDAFSRSDADGMIACYHRDVRFTDPAFGTLSGDNARAMWRMLIENGKGNIKIDFRNVEAVNEKGSADWTAEYVFSKTGRKVINHIHARFEFRDALIFRHVDSFDIWKWSAQALGISGTLLGWTPFMKNKIRENALAALSKYKEKKV